MPLSLMSFLIASSMELIVTAKPGNSIVVSANFLMSIFLATSFTAFFTVSFASSTTGAFAISAAASFASSITSEAFTVVFSTVSLTASVAFVVASLIVSFALEVVLFPHNNLLFQLIGLERVALTVSCVTVSQIPDNVKFLSNFVLLDIF